ncbi:hypothetical protein [Nocardia sp. BMG111209]|uniref:hypothetical protein n=1 Tax=Nocardia sp. BMG111209 TaxID=1160137 RepID=UPI000366E78A|nr:hypothetical protein [Nocardia sp. BMG111209]
MADTARNDPEVVRRLGRALDRYAKDAGIGWDTVSFAQERVDREIAAETDARRRRVDHARRDYEYCMRGEADCSAERRELDRAETELAAARLARRLFDTAAREYGVAARSFARVVDAATGDTKRVLGAIAVDLDRYLRAGSAAVGAAAVSATVVVRDTGPVAPGAAGPDVAPVTIERPPGFPDGFGMVPLALIDTTGSAVHGPADFPADVSPADLEWGLDAFFRIIVPALALGRDLDYFRNRDTIEKRVGARSYADTYTGFLGRDNAPRLVRRTDGRYGVENGYHRIWVAQRMGLATIPGEVIEP